VSTLRLNLIVMVVVIVLATGFVFGLLIPRQKELDHRRGELADKVAAVQSEQRKVGNISDLYESILEMDGKTRDFRMRLPEERRLSEFVNEVCGNLREHDINDYFPQQKPARRLEETRLPDTLQLARGIVVLPVSFTFETGFTTLFDALNGIESLPRLSHVESMKLVNDETQPGRLNVELVLHTYYQPNLSDVPLVTDGK